MTSAPKRVTNQEIIDAYKETGSVWRAAKKVGCAGQTVHKRLARLGYATATNRWSEAEYEELRSLILEGLTLSDVADRLGRSYAAVAIKVSRMDLPREYAPRRRKLPRGSGYDKATTKRRMSELEQSDQVFTRFCRANGYEVESQARAFEVHTTDRWLAYVESHSTTPRRACEYCGAEFRPSNGKQRFCTRKCGAEQRSDISYFGGRKRETVGWAERTCQLCLQVKSSGLASHHVIGKENDPENRWLIALCNGCHDVVTRLSARSFVSDTEQLEALISLVWLRHHGADWASGRETWSVSVSVEVDEFDEEENE